MEDLISIIVLIYKVEKYLDQCICSILNQTYRNIEVILVDDGSTDNCPAMCDRYAELDPRIKVIHKENEGCDGARKAGIRAANGKYVGYVDGDDWIEPDMFETLYRLAEESGALVVESGVIDSYPEAENRRVPYFPEGMYEGKTFAEKIAPRLIYTGTFFQNGVFPYLVTKLFRRDILTDFQLMEDPSDNIVDDTMCVFPCIIAAQSLYITYQCFYHYRVRSDSCKRMVRTDIVPKIMLCYPGWSSRFMIPEFAESIQKQLEFLVMYLLMAKAPSVFDDLYDDKCLIPYGGMEYGAGIVVYGAGMVGIQLRDYLLKSHRCRIMCWADRNYKEFEKELGIQSPSMIAELDFDYAVVAILNARAAESAINDLTALGIEKKKIRWIDSDYLSNPRLLLSQARYESKKIFDF